MKRAISILLCICLLFSLASCGKTAPQEQGKVVRLSSSGDDGLPNPFRHMSRGPGQAKAELVFGSLLESTANGYANFLAESHSENGNVYTFKLREGLTFHDGEELTTEDVAFSLEYYKTHPAIQNFIGYGESYMVESLEIISEREIAIKVFSTDANTLGNLGSFKIIPKHIWQDVEDPYIYDGDGCAIGSGAFFLSGYNKTSGEYQFSAYKNFPLQQSVDTIQFVATSDELLAFQRGEVDIATLPSDLVEEYSQKDGVQILEKSNEFGYKLLVNYERLSEFLDIEARRALYMAIDREKIVESVFRGKGEVGSLGYVPSGTQYFAQGLEQISLDSNGAREILAKKDLKITLLVGNSAGDVLVGEIVAEGLEEAGISVSIKSADSSTRDSLINSFDYDFAIVGNGGWGGRVPNYLYTIFTTGVKNQGGNPHNMGAYGLDSEEISALCKAQLEETDPQKRVELFHQLQWQIAEEMPIITLATGSNFSVYNSEKSTTWTKTFDYQQVEQNVASYMEVWD